MSSRHVVLVCGPPCAGKTTFVEQRAEPDDYVVDFDAFARDLGSPAKWRHPPAYRDAAEELVLEALQYVAESEAERAWVIRSAPEAEVRDQLAAYLRADRVVLLVPDRVTLYARAARRAPGTRRTIDLWFSRYTEGTRGAPL